jgi:hypothetical protein
MRSTPDPSSEQKGVQAIGAGPTLTISSASRSFMDEGGAASPAILSPTGALETLSADFV